MIFSLPLRFWNNALCLVWLWSGPIKKRKIMQRIWANASQKWIWMSNKHMKLFDSHYYSVNIKTHICQNGSDWKLTIPSVGENVKELNITELGTKEAFLMGTKNAISYLKSVWHLSIYLSVYLMFQLFCYCFFLKTKKNMYVQKDFYTNVHDGFIYHSFKLGTS